MVTRRRVARKRHRCDACQDLAAHYRWWANLPDVPAPSRADVLRAEWKSADPERRKVIETEVAELGNGTPSPKDTT